MIDYNWKVVPNSYMSGRHVLIHQDCTGQYAEIFPDGISRCFGCGKIVPDGMLDAALLLDALVPDHYRALDTEQKRWNDRKRDHR